MGQVVPFIARVRDSGDWTAMERARLEELVDRLAAGGVHVEVIFGATDEGDPWCVVTDADGDVLIHVARIGGVFVVHSAVDDAVNESIDLHAALRDSLAAAEEMMAPPSATILPFGLSARQGQTFLALLAATAFFYETSAIGETAEAGERIQALPPADPPPPADADAPAQEREQIQSASLQPTSSVSTTLAAAAPAAAPVEPATDDAPPPAVETSAHAPTAEADVVLSAAAPTTSAASIRGTAADDLLVGSGADEHILGGDGADTLRGGGGHDTLDGGAGDDRIEISADVVAIGGAGADSFVVQAPTHLGRPDTLLGVILDFSSGEGDRLFTWSGEAIRLRPHPDADNKQAPPVTGNGFTGQTPNPTQPQPQPDPELTPPTGPGGGDFGVTLVGPPLTRVDVDLDGDGAFDGYILVGLRGHVLGGADNPIVITGRSLNHGDDPLG